MNAARPIVLGSQSPQRRSLLEQIVPKERIIIAPPLKSEELVFSGLSDREEICQRLIAIARTKNDDVFQQHTKLGDATILTADTIIVVKDGAGHRVLGKPDGEGWQQRVRNWFLNDYSAATHEVITGVCIRFADGSFRELLSSTKVRFKNVSVELLEWYLKTEEPLGKAGGYGIQSAGSLFVESIEGSLSNVIGLPLEIVRDCLQSQQIISNEILTANDQTKNRRHQD